MQNAARSPLDRFEEHLEAGHALHATVSLCPALHSLAGRRSTPAEEIDGLVEALCRGAALLNDVRVLYPMIESLEPYPAARDKLLRTLVGRAQEAGFRDASSLVLYVRGFERDVALEVRVRDRVHTLLVQSLRVRRWERPEHLEGRRRLLECLHAARPRLVYPRLYLGRVALMEHDYARADALFAGISGPMAFKSKVLNLRGFCTRRLGHHQASRKLFEQSLSFNPNQPAIRALLTPASTPAGAAELPAPAAADGRFLTAAFA